MIAAICAVLAPLQGSVPSGNDGRLATVELPAGPAALCPDVVVDAHGGAWVSWIEPAGDGEHALRLARFDGQAFGPAREAARGARWFVNWADFPALAVGDDGGVLASWLVRRGNEATHYDVFTALAPEGAGAFGPPRRLHADETEAEHGFVSLVALAAGAGEPWRFAAVWLDGSQNQGGHGHGSPGSGATALRFAPVAADGTPGASVVLDPRVCDCCQTALVRRASGELVVAYRGRSEEELRDIAFVRVPLEGPPTEPRAVHADGWKIPGCPVNGPALAARGELVAASWFTLGADFRARVQVAFLEAGAEEFGAPRRIDDGAPEGRVDLAFVGESLVASWMERAGDRAEWRVRRVPRDAGAELPPALTVARVPLTRASGFLRLASIGNELLCVFADDGLHAARVWP